jgi:hypothetical protein
MFAPSEVRTSSLRISADAPYSPALLKPETWRNIILATQRAQQQSTFEPCKHLAYFVASSLQSRVGQDSEFVPTPLGVPIVMQVE